MSKLSIILVSVSENLPAHENFGCQRKNKKTTSQKSHCVPFQSANRTYCQHNEKIKPICLVKIYVNVL